MDTFRAIDQRLKHSKLRFRGEDLLEGKSDNPTKWERAENSHQLSQDAGLSNDAVRSYTVPDRYENLSRIGVSSLPAIFAGLGLTLEEFESLTIKDIFHIIPNTD